MFTFNFEKLDVWQKAIDFADLIYNETRAFPREERFGLTNQLRRDLHVGKDVQGVAITRVDPGSAADEVGLSEGDVVVAIDQQPVKTPQEAAAKLQEAAASPKKSALLLLNRRGVTQYVGVSLGDYRG